MGNYLIFQILNFWRWDLEFQRSEMRIGEITNSAEYRMDEQNQNLPFFGIKLGFPNWKKYSENFPHFTISKIIEFPLLTKPKKNNQISEIVEFQKLAIFLKFDNL